MLRLLHILATFIITGLLVGSFAVPAQAAAGDNTSFWLSGHGTGAPGISGYTGTTAYIGKHATLTVDFDWYTRYYGSPTKPRFSLERKTGTTWHTVKASVSFKNLHSRIHATPASYTMPKPAATKTVYYRLKSSAYQGAAGNVVNTSYSKTVKFVYENQARYTGLKRAVYRNMQAYCPNAAIHVGSLTGEAGYYREGGYLIKIDPDLAYYSANDLRTVSLHECAHERQFLNYGKTAAGWRKMEADSKKYFTNDATPAGVRPTRHGDYSGGFIPLEHAADCAALAINPSGYLGYGGYCNPSELRHAKRLLTGHRY